MLDFLGLMWEQLIQGPMVNSLVFLYAILFDNFGLSILLFTVIIRVITLPLTLKQIRLTRNMSVLQPKVKALQEKYKNDRSKLSQETMKLYREHGMNPFGCLGPMLVQMPIWIGLYQAIIQTLPSQPERLIGLSEKLYSWLPLVNEAVPLNSGFLWLNLAQGPAEQKDFLLQFDDFSLYLVYEDKRVCIEVWEAHDSDSRERSRAYSYAEYLQLFGISNIKRTF